MAPPSPDAPHEGAASPLAELHAEFRRQGWHPKAAVAVVRELAVFSALMVLGVAITLASHNPWVIAAAVLLSAVGTLGAATNSHTSSHYATSTSRRFNEVLTAYGYPIIAGLSMTYWRQSHVVTHHPAPNVIGVDDDADLLPLFTMLRPDVERARGLRRFYFEHVQWLLFPFCVWFNLFPRHRRGWTHLFVHLTNRKLRRRVHSIDLALLVAHYALWIGLPALLVGLPVAVALYAARMSLFSLGLFVILAPAHYPPEAVAVSREGATRDFVLAQTATTVNFRTWPVIGLLCSGLQYQIEHHLFPGYSHVHYRAMSPLVRAFCERRGYPYQTLGWVEALRKTFETLRTPKPVLDRLAKLR